MAEIEQAQAPAAGDTRITLNASSEYACYPPANEQACWAITSFKAPFYEPTSRASVDIVAVIDKSGSMRGVKLDLVKKTLMFVIDQLKECDRISLVTYDTQVQLVFGLTKMDKANKDRVKDFVKSITDGSCTNLCGGLLKGMEQIALTQGGEKAQVQSVLLLTDGLANEGITTKDGIIDQMKRMQDLGLGVVQLPASYNPHQPQAQRQQRHQGLFSIFNRKQKGPVPHQQPPPVPPHKQQQNVVPPPPKLLLAEDEPMEVDQPAATDVPSGAKFEGTVYTFGFGSDHDSTLLEAISTQGGGVYYYIDTNEKIPESFADCLGGLLSVVGQNLSFKLEAIGENTMTAVHANRTINWVVANKSCEIPMGDLQSEEERDIVLELKLPALPAPATEPVVNLHATLSYFNVITSELDTVTHELSISRTDGDRGAPSEAVDTQRNRIIATAALKKAEPLADQGKLDEAKKVLQEAIDTLEKSATGKQEFCQALISDLKKSLESMKSRQSYLGHGKLYMHSKMQTHSVQRSNYVDESSYYQNSSKVNFRMLSKK